MKFVLTTLALIGSMASAEEFVITIPMSQWQPVIDSYNACIEKIEAEKVIADTHTKEMLKIYCLQTANQPARVQK